MPDDRVGNMRYLVSWGRGMLQGLVTKYLEEYKRMFCLQPSYDRLQHWW